MILPKDRDPRFITIRRGGTLTDSDHRLLAWWAVACAEHVLPLFRVGAALGPAAPPGDRADSGMGARRDQDVSVPRFGWPCPGCGKRT